MCLCLCISYFCVEIIGLLSLRHLEMLTTPMGKDKGGPKCFHNPTNSSGRKPHRLHELAERSVLVHYNSCVVTG